MIKPIINAVIEEMSTAAAATSLAVFAFLLISGEAISVSSSREVFSNSVTITNPIAKITKSHSACEMS